MGSNLLLTNRQWRKISELLAENRRDAVMIEAVLYREFSGQSLIHAAEVFGLTRVRLHEWHRAIAADGSLARIMAALKLEPASALMRRRGGRPFYHRDAKMVAAVAQIRLQNFCEALRAGSRR
jgi:hypothetical protein